MADKYYIKQGTPQDVAFFSIFVRASDREEIEAAVENPWQCFMETLYAPHETFVLVVNDEPICLYGTSVTPEGFGCPFMIATDSMYRYRKIMHSVAKDYIAGKLQEFDVLVNYVYSKHTSAIRWLKSLGFVIGEPEVYGVKGELFHPFHAVAEE